VTLLVVSIDEDWDFSDLIPPIDTFDSFFNANCLAAHPRRPSSPNRLSLTAGRGDIYQLLPLWV
jgi:hypothetical protein